MNLSLFFLSLVWIVFSENPTTIYRTQNIKTTCNGITVCLFVWPLEVFSFTYLLNRFSQSLKSTRFFLKHQYIEHRTLKQHATDYRWSSHQEPSTEKWTLGVFQIGERVLLAYSTGKGTALGIGQF